MEVRNTFPAHLTLIGSVGLLCTIKKKIIKYLDISYRLASYCLDNYFFMIRIKIV